MKQSEALKILKRGLPTYITGPAGSGKTHLLNQYIDWCEGENLEVAVTASTGIAATHIGGRTIHSWSGMGIQDSMDKMSWMGLPRLMRLVCLVLISWIFWIRLRANYAGAKRRSVACRWS